MIKNITNVRGMKCWGAHSGVKSLRRDLALIYSVVPANAAAVFTQNKVVAEPIKVSRENIKGGIVQAIVINAGNANACTGQQGADGAQAMLKTAAEALGIDEKTIIIASTGIIGEPFPTEDVVKGIIESAPKLSNKSNAGSFAANAILTTDTFPKEGFLEFELDGHEINMGGIAKGSGMIHPNMATMLAFIATDVAIESKLLQKTLKEVVDRTFNMITVDGDTSTNDMVVVMANGKAENDILKSEKDKGYDVFREKLEEMMKHLCTLIVSDGEGSSKFLEYTVKNATDEVTARKICRAVSSSTLVKTAMFGRDPNWGRIVCAAGNANVPFNFEKADLYLGDDKEMIQVLEKGRPLDYDRNYMKRVLRESHIYINLDLNEGKAEATGWGTDLTTDYVLFNSVYTT
ncbi:bifunctional glutamate N-acetyltransferase/amino-acid acetyltransferase ArgJ [uncultured Imperialibacter sp.]|uniref:bifunctional glutamate N-acetyltransferase/amino-acid acetyltransferase ArgJ n=1 Tax=uncultured Imperialibacter sp. TaxID=1672639 RepID=UPI0030DC3D07|tara:strand:- start:741 stop:1952 length:1212 start_codon:yes stop_codon:yes gene_type:complete